MIRVTSCFIVHLEGQTSTLSLQGFIIAKNVSPVRKKENSHKSMGQ